MRTDIKGKKIINEKTSANPFKIKEKFNKIICFFLAKLNSFQIFTNSSLLFKALTFEGVYALIK